MATSLEIEKRRADSIDALREIKDQFLASLNHEIRTPLSGMLGMTDLLLETGVIRQIPDLSKLADTRFVQ